MWEYEQSSRMTSVVRPIYATVQEICGPLQVSPPVKTPRAKTTSSAAASSSTSGPALGDGSVDGTVDDDYQCFVCGVDAGEEDDVDGAMMPLADLCSSIGAEIGMEFIPPTFNCCVKCSPSHSNPHM